MASNGDPFIELFQDDVRVMESDPDLLSGRPGKWNTQLLKSLSQGMLGEDVKQIYNTTKQRIEWWYRCQLGDQEWVLRDVYPGRMWDEGFMGQTAIILATLGLILELPWGFNGRRNGATNPNASCFTEANEVGGGLSLNVLAGGLDNDYTALHWSGNYPAMIRKSPHMHLIGSPEQVTQVATLGGLVDDSRSTGTNAFAFPDNGMYIVHDTDVDDVFHFIVRNNGSDVVDEVFLSPTVGTHYSSWMGVNDGGTHVRVVFQGSVSVDWTDISGYTQLNAAQLQPYFAVVNRAAGQLRQFHLHDFKLIMDRGF